VYRQAVMASVKQRLQAPDVDKQSILTTARAHPPPLAPPLSKSRVPLLPPLILNNLYPLCKKNNKYTYIKCVLSHC